MRTAIIILLAVLVIALLGCGQKMVEVQSGERVICSECGKVIRSDIETRQVPSTEASQYTVREIKEKCSECLAKEAERTRQENSRQVVGSWIFRIVFGDSIVRFNADGTGTISAYPKTSFTWRSTGPGSFSANAQQAESQRKDFSGRVVSRGRQILINGWSPSSGYFGTDRSVVLDRIE